MKFKSVETIGLQEHVAQLVERHGGLRKAARALKVDEGQLSRLRSGKGRVSVGPDTLAKLGLEKRVIFYREKVR